MINGNHYDWESVEIITPAGPAVGITEISYNDERPVKGRYGKGAKPRGIGRGNYQASGSCVLDRDEFERLRLIQGGSLYKGSLTIVVSYANDDMPRISDILKGVYVTKQDTSGKQGEDNVGAVKVDLYISEPIEWNGVSAY